MFWSVFAWLPSVGATELIALDILPSKLTLYLLVVDQLTCRYLLTQLSHCLLVYLCELSLELLLSLEALGCLRLR